MRRKLIYLFFILLLLMSLIAGCRVTTSTTTAASTVTFTVSITDQAGNPLWGAKVVSKTQPEGQLKLTGLSKDDGNVIFDDIETGDYTFYVTRFDYLQVDIAITIAPSNNKLIVKMTPASSTTFTPTTSPVSVTFDQLINQPSVYNGKFIIVEGFYFSGFEIAALSTGLLTATYNPNNLTPKQPLIWITGNLGKDVYDNLYHQTDTPSGYTENFGKVRVTGTFQYGSKYGHLDAYSYQVNVTSGALLPWSPPLPQG
jgi:hypothetical protein